MHEPNALLILSLAVLTTALALSSSVVGDLKKEDPADAKRYFLLAGIAVTLTYAFFTLALGHGQGFLSLGLAIGLIVSISNPAIALSFFSGLLILRPWEFAPESEIALALPKIFAAVCVIAWGLQMLLRKRFVLVWNEVLLCFALYLGWLLFATLVSGHMDPGLSFITEHFTPIVVLFLLASNAFSTKREIQHFFRSLIIAASGLILSAIYMTSYHPTVGADGVLRLASIGLLGNSNDLAAIIALTFPLCLTQTSQLKRTPIQALFIFILACILLYGLVLTQSRGAILSLLVAAFTYVLFCRKGRKLKIPLLLLCALAPAALFTFINRDVAELSGSSSSRMNYVIAGMKMVKAHPVFGVGIGEYPNNYELYTASFYEWGTRTAHSSWVLAFSETGLIGGLLFVLLFLCVFLRAWQIRFQQPVLLCSLVSYGTAMSFLSHTYLFLPYLLYGFVLAASRQGARQTTLESVGPRASIATRVYC